MAQIKKIKNEYEDLKKYFKQSQTQIEIEKQQN